MVYLHIGDNLIKESDFDGLYSSDDKMHNGDYVCTIEARWSKKYGQVVGRYTYTNDTLADEIEELHLEAMSEALEKVYNKKVEIQSTAKRESVAIRQKQITQRYSIPRSTVWHYAKQGLITPIKISERVTVFDVEEIEKAFGI